MIDFSVRGEKFLMLAPMAGFTDSAFRGLARKHGADATVSEFIYSRAVLTGSPKVLKKLSFEAGERPYGIQIFGSDPCEVAEACAFAEEKICPDFIDINFGCPAPNAVGAGAGSALLKDPELMGKIVRASVEALKSIPLTVKMRTGWGAEPILPEAAKMLEQSGAAMIAVHGRSRAAGYSGDANWEIIEQTARCVKIPVVGNGSVEKLDPKALNSSECSGFMVGRAAVGNPWIFAEIKARMCGDVFTPPTQMERAGAAMEYLNKISGGNDDYNMGVCRPGVIAFVKGFAGFKKARAEIAKAKTAGEAKKFLTDLMQ